MAQKKEDYDIEDQEELNSKFSLDKLTIITAISFILLVESFLYFLNVKTSAGFGFKQIIFGLIAGIVITLFLIWTRFTTMSNKYMGVFINLVALIAVPYALSRKYQGTYTTIFMVIGVILALAYSLFYFVKAGKK